MDDAPRDKELRPEDLEAMRADVVAHVAGLPRSKRRRLRATVDQTIARIDTKLASLREDESEPPRPDAP